MCHSVTNKAIPKKGKKANRPGSEYPQQPEQDPT